MPRAPTGPPVLQVRDVRTRFRTQGGGMVHAVNGISFDLHEGELLGVVGESGSGKSVTMLSLLKLLPMPPAEIVSGRALLDGEDLLALDPARLRHVRGAKVGFIFQDPMASLNPVLSVGYQLADLASFWVQIKQMAMPVMVLALFNAAQISRFMRAAVLDNLTQDYVRTARAKGLRERVVLFIHVLRNSLIPVVTLIALGIPTVFGGAIITEKIFRVNGIGELLITAIQGADIPLVQTLSFLFAVLIVLFNLIADVLYGVLDPRIRYG